VEPKRRGLLPPAHDFEGLLDRGEDAQFDALPSPQFPHVDDALLDPERAGLASPALLDWDNDVGPVGEEVLGLVGDLFKGLPVALAETHKPSRPS
jgi:hypothetical protein